MADSSTNPVAPAIDWSAVSADVKCPLCRYNLRGLVEPRCPECGYRFQWAELLDPRHPRHPYIFEQHHRRNFWSFFRTLLAGVRTRRFWTNLRPTHTLAPRRLVTYWLLCSSFLLLIPLAEWLRMGLPFASYNASTRTKMGINANYGPGGRQRWLDTYLPLPPHPQFFRQLYVRTRPEEFWWSVGQQLATILAWPWLTFAALMIFRASMRKAMVQRSHVLRCVIYSADVSVWYVLLIFLAVITCMIIVVARAGNGPDEIDQKLLLWSILLLWLVRLDHLASAYRRYLRFDHPFLTALSSQIVVALAMFILLLWAGFLL